MLLNLPNRPSIGRILLVPLLVAVLLTRFEGQEFVGLGLFLLASLTDFLDGYIARRQQKVTKLGKLLDPAADKILNSAALIALVELGLAPAWMVVVIVAREFAVSVLRSVAAADRVVLAAIVSAKVKTVLQVIAISLLIFYNQLGSFERLAPIALWLATLASVYSGLEYFIRFGPKVFGRQAEGSTE